MIEYRTVTGGVEGNENFLNGMVTPFNTETTIGDLKRGGFKEQLSPGAFSKTLQEQDVVFLFNHDTGKPLARTSVPKGEGSLSLAEDTNTGLMARAEPVQTTYGRDLGLLTRAKVVKGMSFGFEVVKDAWTDDSGRASDPQNGTHRNIQEVRLHEVSAVTFPAYPTTSLSARDSIEAARGIASVRAAKASYADVETCGDCGSTGQYGSFCGDCGGSMSQSKSSNAFCTSCGSAVDDSTRAEHVCPETRAKNGSAPSADPEGHGDSHGQCFASIDATLDEAKAHFAKADRNSLPPDVNQGIDLVTAALAIASKCLKTSGTPDPDSSNGNKYDKPEAGAATSDDDERAEDLLRAMQIRIEMDSE